MFNIEGKCSVHIMMAYNYNSTGGIALIVNKCNADMNYTNSSLHDNELNKDNFRNIKDF